MPRKTTHTVSTQTSGPAPRKTATSSFGTSKREGHDASAFYARSLYNGSVLHPFGGGALDAGAHGPGAPATGPVRFVAPRPVEQWADRIYCHTAEDMCHIPDQSVALAFTSPPYNAGKHYDDDLDLPGYLGLIERVGAEVYRTLVPGGRYVVNIANLGRKPYIPLHAYFYHVHMRAGFLPAGEVIWRKGKGMSGNCAWGSWRSPKAPRLRDLHEYLLVFQKEPFSRPDRGEADITAEEFMAATLSVWDIAPESARRVGHPAPFPVELATRVIQLYSYVGDVVLDPFCGSGSTCVSAALHRRRYVGYDIVPEYCGRSQERLAAIGGSGPDAQP